MSCYFPRKCWYQPIFPEKCLKQSHETCEDINIYGDTTSNRSICGDSNLQQKSFQTSIFPQHESMGGWWMITSIKCFKSTRSVQTSKKDHGSHRWNLFSVLPFFSLTIWTQTSSPPKNNMGGWWMMDNVNPGLINP